MSLPRALVLAAVATTLAGCAPSSSLKRTYNAYQQINLAKQEYPVAREVIDGQPFAVLGAQVEDGLKGLLVLREQKAGVELWRADNNVLIATRNGRVLRTIGFPQDQRDAVVMSGADPLGKPMDSSHSYSFSRRLDLAPDRYGLTAEHELQFVASETVSIHHKPRKLDHWRELVRVRELGSTWKQDLWVDAATGEL